MNQLKTGTPLVPAAAQDGEVVTARVHGEIDLNNSPEFRLAMLDVLLRPRPKKLILDLEQVPYMDSSAVAVLVEGLQKMRRHGGRIFLTHVQPRVRGLLEIARLDTIFVLVQDEQEAMSR
jgi:anti-sigma B factor antagonist